MQFTQSSLYKYAAGMLWLLATGLLFFSHTEFRVAMKDGTFEWVLQSKLPIQANIQGVINIVVDRVTVKPDPELKIHLSGGISSPKVRAPYSIEMGYRFEIVDKGVHFVPFLSDNKIDGHDFTVAQELLPQLFENLSTKPIYTIKKSGLIGLHIGAVLVKDDNLRLTIIGFDMLKLSLSVLLFIGGFIAWKQVKK
jgi:hypothetical protein